MMLKIFELLLLVGIFGVTRSENTTTFPTDDEYIDLGKKAVAELINLTSGDIAAMWPEEERQNGPLTIRIRESPFADAKEKALYGETTLSAPVEKVVKLIAPWYNNRIKWDSDFLDAQEILKQVDKELDDFGNRTFALAITGTTYPDTQETEGYSRTYQRLAGYNMQPAPGNESNSTLIRSVIIIDLDLPVPGFISSIAEKFKPGQVEEFFERFENAALNLQV